MKQASGTGSENGACSYEDGIESQAVAAAVEMSTVSNRAYFKSMAFGLDNRQVMPPFLPVLRSQDVLFGRMLRRCHPGAYVGCVPWMTAHVPVGDRRCRRDAITAHTGVELAYIVGDLLDGADLTCYGRDARRRLLCLGKHLAELAALPGREIEEVIRLAFLSRTGAEIRRLESEIQGQANSTEPWTEDAARHLAALRVAVRNPRAAVPEDVRDPGGEPWRRVRELFGQYGQLLIAWPDCLEGARRVREAEHGLV